MATSGTSTFNPDLTEIIEEAFERAGVEARSGYDFRTARRSLNILLQEWANRGLNLWTIDSQTQALVVGTASYNLASGTLDVLDAIYRTGSGTSQQDVWLERKNVSDYLTIPNKLTRARPSSYYVTRTASPTITLWPVPDAAETLVYWRMRYMEDAGNGVNTLDLPRRMVPAMIAGLAFHIAMKKPALADRAPALLTYYEQQFELAAGEDRDRASVYFVPWAPF